MWQRLDQRIAALTAGVGRRTLLGKAATYWTNQREALGLFLTDGHVPMSNAHVERMLRLTALLRKNALFMGSLEAGRRYAALMTLTLNCKLLDINPFVYFRDIFTEIAAGRPANHMAELMPARWLTRQKPQ